MSPLRLYPCHSAHACLLQCRSMIFTHSRKFTSGVTCISRLPPAVDPAEHCYILGHADGVVRLVSRSTDGWKLLQAIKPHKVPLQSFQSSYLHCDWLRYLIASILVRRPTSLKMDDTCGVYHLAPYEWCTFRIFRKDFEAPII
jgi:hypothetical protein